MFPLIHHNKTHIKNKQIKPNKQKVLGPWWSWGFLQKPGATGVRIDSNKICREIPKTNDGAKKCMS